MSLREKSNNVKNSLLNRENLDILNWMILMRWLMQSLRREQIDSDRKKMDVICMENVMNRWKLGLVRIGAVLACMVMLTGCGDTAGRANVDEGMDAIVAMDYAAAMESFQMATEKGESKRLIARGMGIASMGLTDYEGAVKYFKECLSYSDGVVEEMDYDVNYYLAAAYCKLGQYDKAEKIYTAILAIKKEETQAIYLRGNARLELGMEALAIEDFETALKLEPENYDMLIRIYQVLEAHGKEQEGLDYLTFALRSREKQMAPYDKGMIHYYLGNYSQACVFLEEAKGGKKEREADVYLYLGLSYEATGDYNYAITNVYTSYLKNHEGDAAIYNQLGLCYMQQGSYDLALAAFQSAMQIPNNGMLQTLKFNEVVAYEYLGQYTQATALLNSYLQTYPDDEAARREYEFLRTR